MAERESEYSVLSMPDPLCGAAGCSAHWGHGNQLFVHAAKMPPKDVTTGLPQQKPVLIHEVRWDTDMHSPIIRKLVNQTHDIFMKMQQNAAASEKSQKTSMSSFSREYRAVLKDCVMDLQAALEQSPDGADKSTLEGELELYDITELIWNLCEILFVEALPGGMVLLQLLDWLRLHFVQGFKIAQECMRMENAEEHDKYWDAVTMLVLQGSTEEARRLLATHSHRTPAFQLLDQMLRTMPVFTNFPGYSVAEFNMRWKHWQDECTQRLESGEFVSNNNLQNICRILCGQDDVFLELQDLIGSWYSMLISRLFYQNPGIKAFDLQYHTQFCIDAYGGSGHLQPWDHILMSVLEIDIPRVIRESSVTFSNWWFVAHLTDLLHHCGKVESQTLYYGSNLREFLLLEYSTSLMSHHSLWQVAADYLDHCPQFGRYYLEQYIEHMPLETEQKANKVLRICEQRKMVDQVRSICKSMGMRALQNERLGSSLSWALRSKDAAFVTFLAEKFLNMYSETGDFSNIELIDNLGSSMLLSGKLTFLGKYREFHTLYQEEEFHAAAALLLSLLTARVAPKKFWLILLTDALPLLETKQVIFDSDQTYELMHCLEELRMAQKLHIDGSEELTEVEQEKLELLKLALARNLSRAIVHEGTQVAS